MHTCVPMPESLKPLHISHQTLRHPSLPVYLRCRHGRTPHTALLRASRSPQRVAELPKRDAEMGIKHFLTTATSMRRRQRVEIVCEGRSGGEGALEGEVVGSSRRRSVDLHRAGLHGVADVDRLVDVLGEDAALNGKRGTPRIKHAQMQTLARQTSTQSSMYWTRCKLFTKSPNTHLNLNSKVRFGIRFQRQTFWIGEEYATCTSSGR